MMSCCSNHRCNSHVGTMDTTQAVPTVKSCCLQASEDVTACCTSGAESGGASASSTSYAEEDEESDSPPSRHTWTISGIDCPSCISKVETALHRLDGLIKAHITFATLRLTVDFDASRLSLSQIEAAVTGLGYGLSGVGDRADSKSSLTDRMRQHRQLLVLAGLMIVGGLSRLVVPEWGGWVFWPAALVGTVPDYAGRAPPGGPWQLLWHGNPDDGCRYRRTGIGGEF